MYYGFHTKLYILIRHFSLAENRHIRRISEGSRDTEEWKMLKI